MPENLTESFSYTWGMITGIKTTLCKLTDLLNEAAKEGKAAPETFVVSKQVLQAVNEFPTIEENGKFIVDEETGYPVFSWIQERRELFIVNVLGESN